MDTIDRLSGIATGSALDRLRDARPQARAQAEASYRALFDAADTHETPLIERLAVAYFVALLHGDPNATAHYSSELDAHAGAAPLRETVRAAAEAASGRGPYGHYPPGRLTVEDTDGPVWVASAAARDVLGGRLSAALEHAHMLVLHPRDADPAAIEALLEAGWSASGIVTLAQLVSFLAFQIRAAAGLRAVAAVEAQS